LGRRIIGVAAIVDDSGRGEGRGDWLASSSDTTKGEKRREDTNSLFEKWQPT